jgi:hypothetical protein
MDGKDQNGNTASDAVSLFENHAQKKISILHWGTPWFNSTSWPTNNYYPFQTNLFEKVRARGSISLFTWGPWDGNGNKATQPNFSLSRIINGSRYGANCDITVTSTCKTFDMFITEWATAAKNWGYPFFLRFAWEMNGSRMVLVHSFSLAIVVCYSMDQFSCLAFWEYLFRSKKISRKKTVFS